MLPLWLLVRHMREQEDPATRHPDLTLYLAQKDAAQVLPELTIDPALLPLKVTSCLPCVLQQQQVDCKAIPYLLHGKSWPLHAHLLTHTADIQVFANIQYDGPKNLQAANTAVHLVLTFERPCSTT